MARPPKEGLEYFGLDVKMDEETELIKAQHGIKGFGILISAFQMIYGNKGYYLKWNERNQLLLSNKVNDDINTVITIISDCIKWEIFNKEMYEKYNILTSRRIQKQYIDATYKREEVEIIEDYLVIKKKKRGNISYIKVSDNGNHDTTRVSDSNNKQSIVKYSKVYKDPVQKPEGFRTKRYKKIINLNNKPQYDKDSNPYKAALYLKKLIEKNNPRQPVPEDTPESLEDWSREMDRLNRLGPVGVKKSEGKGYTWSEIKQLIRWCQDDEFWQNNILSAGKFRKQIVVLEGRMKKQKSRASPVSTKKDMSEDEMAEYYKRKGYHV